jgi:hypothetical protein
MTRSRFDIEYNKRLQQVNVGEDDSVWNEIQDELDFIETWDNISAKLDVIKPQKGRVIPMRLLRVIAASAAVILIMFLPVRYFIEQANQPIPLSELSIEDDKKEVIISDDQNPLIEINEGAELNQRTVYEMPPSKNLYEESVATSSSSEVIIAIIDSKDSESTANITEELELLRIQNIPFDTNTLIASNNALPPFSKVTEFNYIPEPSKSSVISIRVVDVGLMYGYKNTWLLNHETRNGLNPSKLGAALPTFHQDIGLTSSLEINNRHLFGLEFLWKSEAGQNYQQYINASYVERNINLDYQKLQSFYVWRNKKIPGQVIIGGYFARLTLAEEIQDKTRFSVDDRYSDLDYGLLTGYQLNIALRNRIIIKPSVRVSYNLVNIFEGDDITPSHFKRTKNLAASFNVSLSYRFF